MTESRKYYLSGLSSLYRYYGISQPYFSFVRFEGSIVDIAREHEQIDFPGVDGIDALVSQEGKEMIYQCIDNPEKEPEHPFPVMNLYYESGRGVFIDRADCYRQLRGLELGLMSDYGSISDGLLSWTNLLEAAALVSSFGFNPTDELLDLMAGVFSPEKESSEAAVSAPAPLIQKIFLSAVLTGKYPAAGLKMLKDFGFIDIFWPELGILTEINQSKEYHPEGNVWEHTLETLYHRKTADLDLSLALLLHDAGKPLADDADGNRFNRHAQIGKKTADDFLRRLEFPAETIEKVCFLVENHMLPAAIKTLPTFRTEPVMSSPHFPLLLEVFRCDLLSTFRGPEAYYEACKVYKSFLKNTNNPFRNSDGKKLYRLYVN